MNLIQFKPYKRSYIFCSNSCNRSRKVRRKNNYLTQNDERKMEKIEFQKFLSIPDPYIFEIIGIDFIIYCILNLLFFSKNKLARMNLIQFEPHKRSQIFCSNFSEITFLTNRKRVRRGKNLSNYSYMFLNPNFLFQFEF